MTLVLVTGSHGMLGSELCRTLRESFDAVGVDVDDFDVTEAEVATDAVARLSPDVVVNCAAYTDVDGSESNSELAFSVNAKGAGNIARAARAIDAYTIHISTDYVFDGSKREPYTEDDVPCPLGAYGESKLAGEREVAEAGGRHLVVRTSWLYGRGGANFVETILELAGKQERLRVVDDQVGSPTNVADLSAIIKDLIPLGATGTLNATNSGSCSWCDFARRILELSGRLHVTVEPVKTDAFPRPAARPAYSVLSLTRLSSLLGWLPRPWDEALADYIAER